MPLLPRVSFARRRFRQLLRSFLWANRLVIVLLCGGFIGIAWLLAFLGDGYPVGFAHGLLAGSLVAMVGVIFLAHTGSIWQLAGAWGEDNTRDVLKWATRRRYIWGSIDNIELANGDIDHLVITSGGVIAIDSKWHASVRNHAGLTEDVRRATAAAAKAKSVLRSLKRPTEVRPVVVMWGAGQHGVPEGGDQVEGVEIVAGKHLRQWLRSLGNGDLERDQARVLLHELADFRRRVDPSRTNGRRTLRQPVTQTDNNLRQP